MYVSKKDAATADLVRSAKAIGKPPKDTRGYGKMPKPPDPLQGFAMGGYVYSWHNHMRNDYSGKAEPTSKGYFKKDNCAQRGDKHG